MTRVMALVGRNMCCVEDALCLGVKFWECIHCSICMYGFKESCPWLVGKAGAITESFVP